MILEVSASFLFPRAENPRTPGIEKTMRLRMLITWWWLYL
jgi:hypothetical protein